LPLGERPAVVDLATELGWSERSTLRMSQRFFGAYFPAACGHWRRYLRMWRLNAAATLLSTEDLSVGEVSARVGFSSPTSLCHALEQAGWPSAGAIRREFDQ
jgi:AraC-like DNA-binding protein